MPSAISLFSGYQQTENRTTNYCLLALKLIYEENPSLLAEAVSDLAGDESLMDLVGVRFMQQTRTGTSIPDAVIVQAPFAMFVETKNSDWFYDDQLEAHIKNLDEGYPGVKVLIALSNFETDDPSRFTKIFDLCESIYADRVKFVPVSFEMLIRTLGKLKLSKRLDDLVSELRNYLDEQGLLSSWEYTLDVVNCAGIPEDVLDHNVYMCPATGGAYSHSRCKYFGMYREKKVGKIALIRAVVDVVDVDSAELKWKNVDANDTDLLKEAREIVSRARDEYPTRIFLLGELHDTSFLKDTKGGMLGSKQYFDVAKLEPQDAEDLAGKLHNNNWSDYYRT